MKYTLIICLIITSIFSSLAQEWKIESTRAIIKSDPISYNDNIEMAGKKVAGIITYDLDSLGELSVERQLIFPQLRTYLQDNDNKWAAYRAYLKELWTDDALPIVYTNEKVFNPGKVSSIVIDGTLIIEHRPSNIGLSLKREFFPSVDQRLFIEKWTIVNSTDTAMNIIIGNSDVKKYHFGPNGRFSYGVKTNAKEQVILKPKEKYEFDIQFYAYEEGDKPLDLSALKEDRVKMLDNIHENLVLKTPDPILNTLFAFSKVRATESIFDSKMGIVHSPGGGRYYAGVWANDQAEYSGPFFPYLGIKDGNVAALNAYKKFWEHMQTIPNYERNIMSSFEMNGDLTCCGADRGDAAMIAYGGLHYLLATGDKAVCKAYEPMINWCLTWNHLKLNDEGVVMSQSDEMESRIETGSANLSTSSLYYGALDLAIDYYTDLGSDQLFIADLQKKKEALGKAIESYFGSKVEGLDTYQYYKDHTYLRHWICLPLVVGIHDRTDATVEALFDRLWTENGVHVEKNSDNPDISKIFWDRGTLYALRGTIIAGETEVSLRKLQEFSSKRLLGDHVPYVVEAYPEGNMAHLSAESALYCRIFIEGMFGIKPTGTKSFEITPRLPKEWNEMSLDKIMAFGIEHNIKIERTGKNIKVTVIAPSINFRKEISLQDGETMSVTFAP
jgi:hypothetical protein